MHSYMRVSSNELAARARRHEQRGEIVQARELWKRALPLLPHASTQAEWVRTSVRRLDALAAAGAEPAARAAWVRKLGPLAPLAILLIKGKWLLALFKLKFLLSLGAFVAFYWALFGAKFGIGFAILILVHEMGHFIDIRRRGLPAEMPVFLPGLGAYVRWTALGVTARTRAFVSLAGPLAGCIGAAVCVLLWMYTGNTLWIGLASVSALLNVLNLIPGLGTGRGTDDQGAQPGASGSSWRAPRFCWQSALVSRRSCWSRPARPTGCLRRTRRRRRIAR